MSTLYSKRVEEADAYNFKKFDPKILLKVCPNFSGLIVSKRRTGKSVLLKDICYHLKNEFDLVYVFSGTAHLQPDLFNYVDKEFCINFLNENLLKSIFDKQEEINKFAQKFGHKKEQVLNKVLILFDDIIMEDNFKKSPILKKIFVQGRHLMISTILISQTFSIIPPLIRKNADFAICFYLDHQYDRESFSKSYLSVNHHKIGERVLENITREEYNCLVCISAITTNNLENNVYWYKANLKVPYFKLGKIQDLSQNKMINLKNAPAIKNFDIAMYVEE